VLKCAAVAFSLTMLLPLVFQQEQKVEYDEEAIRDQVVTAIKAVKVVQWLKDNVKVDLLPWEGEGGQQ
jgi:hypothetical protein